MSLKDTSKRTCGDTGREEQRMDVGANGDSQALLPSIDMKPVRRSCVHWQINLPLPSKYRAKELTTNVLSSLRGQGKNNHFKCIASTVPRGWILQILYCQGLQNQGPLGQVGHVRE